MSDSHLDPQSTPRKSRTAAEQHARRMTIMGITLISIFGALILAVVILTISAVKKYAAIGACMSNEKQIALAMLMWAEDHNKKLPSATTWAKDIMPYTKNAKILRCLADDSNAKCSYAMNAALSGKKLDDIDDPLQTVILYETAHPGDSPSGGIADVLRPARHNDGNHYTFVDGHVMWFKEPPPFWPKKKSPGK